MGVVGALKSGRSRNSWKNASLQRIVSLFSLHGIFLTITDVPTLQNPADGPSRGVFPSMSNRLASSFRLPARLSSYISDVIF